jgi:RHS repeat-associated protein
VNPLPYGHKTFGDEQYKNNTSAFSVSARYTGQVLDEDTGLYYYGARYYDPQLARFIQPDSVVPEELNSQALNRYSYCINNPLKFTDPTGQSFWSAVAAIVNWLTSAKVATAIVVAAAVGAGMAAATGGDVLKGALAGAIGGMFGVGFNPVMAMAGGAVGALVTGGDPLMGAMTAGISAGVGACFAKTPLPGVLGRAVGNIGNVHLRNIMFSAASGALCGGVTAEIFGGDFGSGALFGAAAAAAEYVVYSKLYSEVPTGDGGPRPNPGPTSTEQWANLDMADLATFADAWLEDIYDLGHPPIYVSRSDFIAYLEVSTRGRRRFLKEQISWQAGSIQPYQGLATLTALTTIRGCSTLILSPSTTST